MRIAVVIPAHNEESSLPLVLDAIPKGLVEEVVVVDNARTDRTADAARSRGATLLFEPRRGYGAACLRGVTHLETKPPEVVVFLDADYSDHPDELPRLLWPLTPAGSEPVIA